MELIDFHAHILPHMDHGSRHTATAHGQLDVIQAAGVAEVCATSHFYPQSTLPDVFLSDRVASVEHLLHTYGDKPRPKLLLGAEVLICPGLDEMEGLANLCVEGTHVLLLEMPFTDDSWSRDFFTTARNIRDLGITPVLAHVDRYPYHLIEQLFEYGLHGQVNADALDCFLKPRRLLHWMDEGHIVALGSDLHGSDPLGYRAYEKFIRKFPDYAEMVMGRTHNLLRDAVRH